MLRRLKLTLPAIQLANRCRRGREGVMVIEDKTFSSRRIDGPAVLYPVEDSHFEGCSFYGHPDAILCEYEGSLVPIGAIVLRKVTFKECDFRDVSILARPDVVARMRLGINQLRFEESEEAKRGILFPLPLSHGVGGP